jgi:hypothetical protein
MLIVTSIVATGAGLHVAAYFIEGRARIPAIAVVLAVAVPVAVFLGLLNASTVFIGAQQELPPTLTFESMPNPLKLPPT